MRVEAEASSLSSQSEFRPLTPEQATLFESSPNPVLVLDVHFRIRFVNRIAGQLGHVDPAELIGLNVWERYPEFKGTIFHQAYAAVLDEQVARRFEEYTADSDSWRSVLAYPADGGVVAVLEDVTLQRRAERALRESEQALARAQAVAAIGSWMWTLPDTLQWSAETFRILGVDPIAIAPDLNLIRDHIVDEDEREEWTRALEGAIGDHCGAHSLLLQRRERELRHLASAEHHGTAPGEPAEDLLAQLHRGRADAQRAVTERRLAADAPSCQ